MAREVGTRLFSLLVLVLLVSVIVFSLTLIIPGDPVIAILGENATAEQVETLREAMGLNDPVVVRYWTWLSSAVTGDLGTSLYSSYPVIEGIKDRAHVTFFLVFGALLISICVGIALGVVSALRPNGFLDRIVLVSTSSAIAMPTFWLGIVLLTYFSVAWGLFPTLGYAEFSRGLGPWLHHLMLPMIALAAAGVAEVARQTRASVIDATELEFVTAMRIRGIRKRRLVLMHVLRLALIPVVTVAGLQVSRLFGMSVLVEIVFGLPGIGRMLVDAVFSQDIPIIQGTVMMITIIIVVTNLVVDLSYRWLNPRVA